MNIITLALGRMTNLKQITHIGCNFAKNDVSKDAFDEWLAVVRAEIANAVDEQIG